MDKMKQPFTDKRLLHAGALYMFSV